MAIKIGALCATALVLGGCIQRTLVITSEPEGAVVWVNDVEVGRTPLETDFTFYGTYDVRLRKEGYEALSTSKVAWTPVHEVPPIDFFVMALPWTTEKRVKWHFELEPLAEVEDTPEAMDALRERADEMRSATTGSPGG